MNITPATKPTIIAANNGLKAMRFTTSAYLRSTEFATAIPGQQSTYAQPYTLICVFRLSSDISAGGTNLFLLGSSSVQIRIANAGGGLYFNAGADSSLVGPSVMDGNWHVGVITFGTASNAVWLDGYLTMAGSSQSHGTNGLTNLFLGSGISVVLTAGTQDIAEAIVCQSILTLNQVDYLTQSLANKWGIR